MNIARWLTTLDAWGFAAMRMLLAALWQSSVLFAALGAVAWALRRRRASARHALWVGALLLAPLLPLLTALATRAHVPQAPVAVLPDYERPAISGLAHPAAPVQLPPVVEPLARPTVPAVAVSAPGPPLSVWDYPWALMLIVYLSGLSIFLALFAVGHVRIRRWIKDGVPLRDERGLSIVRNAGKKFGVKRRVRALESGRVAAPITVGVLRPTILFPQGMVERLSETELASVALHETAHIKRHDPLVLSFAALVRAVLFFHPLVWLTARQIAVLAEQAADDAVLDAACEPLSYAKLLTRLAEDLPRRSPSTEFAAGIVLSKGPFLRRVEAILSDRRAQIRRLTRLALAGAVLGGVVSLGIALAVPLTSSEGPPGQAAASVAELAKRVRAALPVAKAEGPVLSHRWEVVQCDEAPSIKVDGAAGCRVLIRETLQEYEGPQPQRARRSAEDWDRIRRNPENFRTNCSHIDLVLFPSEQHAPADFKSRIPWEDLEQQRFACPAYLGDGHGFAWFGLMPIERQFFLREQLGLDGGDDPLQVAAEGLGAEDPGTVNRPTAHFCARQLEDAGEQAIPYLEQVIGGANDYAAQLAVKTLGAIPGDQTTGLLRAYHGSVNQTLADGAEGGLCKKPYREAAKDAYLDMLERRSHAGELHRQAAEACVEFGWKEAVPRLEVVCARPHNYWHYRFAFESKRAIEGNPAPPAPGYIADLEEAKAAILACEDKEAAVLWALELVLDDPKGGAPKRNQAGRDVLAQLPQDVSKPIVVHLAHNLGDYEERERIATLLKPDSGQSASGGSFEMSSEAQWQPASTPSENRGVITGTVVNAATGQPVVGAHVGVGDFGDSGGSNYAHHRAEGRFAEAETDEEGAFVLDGLRFWDAHPLVVTHPEFVRHDQVVALTAEQPEIQVSIRLRPAARLDVTVVDADGRPAGGCFLLRLERLDGRHFMPPGRDPHQSSFASSSWAEVLRDAPTFSFAALDTGQYAVDAFRITVAGARGGDGRRLAALDPKKTVYHGGVSSVAVSAGESRTVEIEPADHQARLTIRVPEKAPELPEDLPTVVLVSRKPGLLLWDDGEPHGPEDPRLGRVLQASLLYSAAEPGSLFTVSNLPPGRYSVFAGPALYMTGAKAELSAGSDVNVAPRQFEWDREKEEFPPPFRWVLSTFVHIEKTEYTVEELCGLLTEIRNGQPEFKPDPSIRSEKVSPGRGGVSIWDLLEKIYLEKGWRIGRPDKQTLILRPGQTNDVGAPLRNDADQPATGGAAETPSEAQWQPDPADWEAAPLPPGWEAQQLWAALREHVVREAQAMLPGCEIPGPEQENRVIIQYRTQEYEVFRPGSKAAEPPREIRREVGPRKDGLILHAWFDDSAAQLERPATLTAQTTDGHEWQTHCGVVNLLDTGYLCVNLSYGSETNRETLDALCAPTQWLKSVASSEITPSLGTGNPVETVSGSGPAKVQKEIERLSDSYPRERYEAAYALRSLADARAIEPLIDVLQNDPDTNVRYGAAQALDAFKDPRSISPLIEALREGDRQLKLASICTLREMGDPRIVEAFIVALKDEDETVRLYAASALGLYRDPRVVEPLIEALKDPEYMVRAEAASSLRSFNEPRVVDALINALDDAQYVAWMAATVLNEFQDMRSIGPLVQHIDRISDYLQNREPFSPENVERYRDEHPALRTLIRMGARSVAPLIASLRTGDGNVNPDVVWTLGEVGDLRAVEPLIDAADDGWWRSRKDVAEALGKIGDRSAVEVLIELLSDEQAEVSQAAALALQRIAGQDFGQDAEKWRKWLQQQKTAAADALAMTQTKGASPAAQIVEAGRPSKSKAGLWEVRLWNGAVVELVGVAYFPAGETGWWRPDGSPLAEPPYDDAEIETDGWQYVREGKPMYQVALSQHCDASKGRVSVLPEFVPKVEHFRGGFGPREGQRNPIEMLIAGFPETKESVDLHVTASVYDSKPDYWSKVAAEATFRNISLKPGGMTKVACDIVEPKESDEDAVPFEKAVFGAVNTRVLNEYKAGTDCFIDLDTGRLFSSADAADRGLPLQDDRSRWHWPESEPKRPFVDWLSTNGIDAVLDSSASSEAADKLDTMHWFDAVAVTPATKEVADLHWHEAPALARSILRAERRILNANRARFQNFDTDKLPSYVSFKTAEGGIGVVEVTKDEGPESQGLVLRYKSVENSQLFALPGPELWLTLMPHRDELRSFEDYRQMARIDRSQATRADTWSCEVEIRAAANGALIARLPYLTGNWRAYGSEAEQQLSMNRLRQQAPQIRDGRYLVAITRDGARCSNVASVAINENVEVAEQPTLVAMPLPTNPKRALPHLGLRAIGPTPPDPELTNFAVAFPTVVVDGVERRRATIKWAGTVSPVESGRLHTNIIDLSLYAPPIAPKTSHEVYVKIGQYTSAPVTIPAQDAWAPIWDEAAAAHVPLEATS